MNENDFDEFFGKKLLKYSSPVPGDMWQRILRKKNKDRKRFFFKWGLALIPIFLTAGYFTWHLDQNTGNGKAITDISKQNTDTQNNSNEASKNTGKNGLIKTNPDTGQINQTSNSQSNKHVNNNEKDIYSIKRQNMKSTKDQYFSGKETSSGKYSIQKNQPAKYIRKSRFVKDSTNIHIGYEPDSSINNQANENIIKEYPDSTSRQAIKVLPLPEDSSLKKEPTPLKDQSKKDSGLSTMQKKWFLDVYVSPDIPFSEITSGNTAFIAFIKKSFKTNISYTIGAGIGRSITKHFSLKTGFQYSKINAKLIDSSGIANHYMSIDIPFLIGYEIKNTDFETTINAGGIFNLYSWYKGEDIAKYKNYTGISLYAGINFAKQINNKIELFAEPYFRYRLSYMTKPQAPFNQKIHVAGALFGLKYNF